MNENKEPLCHKTLSELIKESEKFQVKVGKYYLSRSKMQPNCLWIERDDGEAGEFSEELLEKTIDQFYNRNF